MRRDCLFAFSFVLVLLPVQAQWIQKSTGLPDSTIVTEFVNVNNTFFSGTLGEGLFSADFTNDDTLVWSPSNNGLFCPYVLSIASNSSTIFIGTEGTGDSTGVYVSIDNGTSWSLRNNGLKAVKLNGSDTNSYNIISIAANDSLIFASVYLTGIFVSSDNGQTWNQSNGNLPKRASNGFYYVGSLVLEGTTLYAGINGPNNTLWGLYKSTDYGITWVALNTSPSICEIVVSDSNIYVDGNGGFSSSTDAGATWSPLNTQIINTGLGKLKYVNGIVYATHSYTKHLYASFDNGVNWSLCDEGLNGAEIQSLASTQTKLLVWTNDGVWARQLLQKPTGIESPKLPLPDKFELLQNYPNPFNPSTQIQFELPKTARVTMKIYNVLGMEVATIVDGELSGGTRVATWNAQDMPSGVYFCRMTADKFAMTKRIVLMK